VDHLHFWHEIKAHLLKVRVLSHDGHSHRVHLVIVEVELYPSRRGTDEVPPVLEKFIYLRTVKVVAYTPLLRLAYHIIQIRNSLTA
jgi:hypothetical protein